jgi:F0F1-type ATP synthase gamma subunit
MVMLLLTLLGLRLRARQASLLAEELLKSSNNPEAIRVVYNKFKSAISYKPTIATVLSAEVRPWQCSRLSMLEH